MKAKLSVSIMDCQGQARKNSIEAVRLGRKELVTDQSGVPKLKYFESGSTLENVKEHEPLLRGAKPSAQETN